MSRATSILVVASLFLSGVAVGALGMHLYYFDKLSGPRGPGHGARMHWRPFFAERLGLTQEQEQQIETILADSHRRSNDIRRDMRPQIEQLIEETHSKIVEVLTPEQRLEFERMRKFQRRHAERLFLGPGPPGRRGGRPGRFGRRDRPPPP